VNKLLMMDRGAVWNM